MRKVYVIDLFCGAGGTSTGVHKARYMGLPFAYVIYCVNHDPIAIDSHKSNHKATKHYIEDIKKLNLAEILATVARLRAEEPDCIIILWASLECTNFSKAKGGLARDADSRTLAEHLIESEDEEGILRDRYIPLIKPDYVWIENVEEFMAWGPLDDNGKPISKKAGQDYLRWVEKIKSLGYDYDYRIMNAADYGAYTSRKRYFSQFAMSGLPMIWPHATHAKKTKKNIMGRQLFANMNLKPWKPVKHCLDFSDEGNSIFGRKKELSERTLEKIYAGLIKYIAGGKEAFISKYYSGNPNGKHSSIDDPLSTITTIDHNALVSTSFLKQYNSGTPEHRVKSMDEPCNTITTNNRFALVQPEFIAKYYGQGGGQLSSINEPCGTLLTKDRMSLIKPKYFIDKQYSGKDNHQSINQPAGTIMPNDKHCLIRMAHFIDKPYKSGTTHSSVESPAGTITTVPKMNLVKCWLMNTNYGNVGSGIDVPAHTLTASRRHQYLMNPQYASKGVDMESPSFTLIARMDKAPPYLVSTEDGLAAIAIFESDTPAMVLIKEFMALYGIIDIKMRMLKVPELLKIQGFPDGYILKGTQADQKKFIGNSVVPEIVTAWMEAFYDGITNAKAA